MKSIISFIATVCIAFSSVPISFADEGEGPLTDVEINCLIVPTLRRPEVRRDGMLFSRKDAATVGLYFKYCSPNHLKQIKDLEDLNLKLDKQVETSTTIISLKDGVIEDKEREIELLEASKQPLWEQILIYTGIAVVAGGAGLAVGVVVSK